MVQETIEAVAGAAEKKSGLLGRSLMRYLVLSALAGAYVGLGIALIFAIGAPLAAASSPFLKVVMGASFGVALTLVIFAGSELFTGNALVLTIGALTGRSNWGQLGAVWVWSYLGNLVGSVALAWLIAQSGALGGDPQRGFIETVAGSKMSLPFGAAFARGILANWLVCLAVWCSMRTTNDLAKLVLIFWCLFAFIGAGFEHSIANMTLLALALFQPHGEAISWAGYLHNLVPVTLGNIVGGAVMVGGLYWFSSPLKSESPAMAAEPIASSGGIVAEPLAAAQ
ncbi:MAG TPA: formate/nitrite transporter family protein [Chloroflexota bacterium]|nr:formate/nitrite transporter family protein [Chloroflexota bacterium]